MKEQEVQSDQWWDDPEFQDNLVGLLVHDYQTLRKCSALLSPNDFRPQRGAPNGRSRWMIAERALEFFKKHNEPMGKMLRSDLLSYANELSLGALHLGELKEYMKTLGKMKPVAPSAVVDKVVEFKSGRLKTQAIEELIELQSNGALTDEKWQEISRKALAATKGTLHETTNYLSTLSDRMERRINAQRTSRIPYTFIDPLDMLVHTVGPKQLGCVLAPYKRGKSLFLLWLAVAFARQRINTLYVTLEDPKDVVEDRLDSIATNIPLKNLVALPKTLRRRFERFRNMVHAQIEVYDGTDGGVTVQTIDSIIANKRDQGFITHAVITDYDEELKSVRRYKEKRFETDEIYREYREMLSRWNAIGWLAAQTQRETRHLKILSGDKVAEDIGKMKKVTCGISMGKGDWTEDSIYLWVAAHKTDKMEVGCEIVPDLKAMMIYDEEATRKQAKANAPLDEP